jgi:hypothetical protein
LEQELIWQWRKGLRVQIILSYYPRNTPRLLILQDSCHKDRKAASKRQLQDLRKTQDSSSGCLHKIIPSLQEHVPSSWQYAGVAVREFWHVDDKTIIFVADPSLGNILNFSVGAGVDVSVPRNFWKRLAGKYGNLFYWHEKGEDASIEAAVSAISNCLRQQINPHTCSEIW